ncbi:MAG: hypothetical protein DCC71_18590 [Proteobacteria bacterium]|nr:MAG: hypothetical protein DCC71_18590 [Pseudomonadota bacterium]
MPSTTTWSAPARRTKTLVAALRGWMESPWITHQLPRISRRSKSARRERWIGFTEPGPSKRRKRGANAEPDATSVSPPWLR